MVYKREDWNDLIERVNQLAENPDAGCDPVDPLDPVDPEHIWAKSETRTGIRQVHDKLKEICKDNEFDDIPDLWKQSIIDEINAAIDNGWCDCDKCQAEDETFVIFQADQYCSFGGLLQVGCNEGGLTTPQSTWFPREEGGGHFDWYSSAVAVSGYDEGIGGSVTVRKYQYVEKTKKTFTYLLYSNTFNCDGSQREPLPQPQYNADGTLKDSVYFTSLITGVNCTLRLRVCVLGFCQNLKCVIGMCACDGADGCDLDAALAQAEAECGDGDGYLGSQTWVVIKRAPLQFHGEGGPCRECCEDGIGYVGVDCPDPDEEEPT